MKKGIIALGLLASLSAYSQESYVQQAGEGIVYFLETTNGNYMTDKMKKVIIALCLLASLSAYSQESYVPQAGEGIVYFLPKTKVAIDIIATKVDYQPGDFSLYASRYLRLNNISSQPESHWEIKDIQVRLVGVPDSTKAYIMKLKDKSMASNVELTDKGIVKAINTTSTEKESLPDYKLEKPQPHENARKYMTEDILMAGSSAKMAELTAREIYNIRDSKNTILRGQAETMPKDGASLQLVIDQLNKQEKALMQAFTGTTDRTDKVFTILVEPGSDTQEQVAARFSTQLGVLPTDNLAGDPIYVSIRNTSTLPMPEEDKKKKKADGAIYNVPGKGNVTVTYQGKKLFNDEMAFTQFGYTEVLVDGLFDKKVNTRVIFNSTTGGILKIDKD